jgi:hypothetical protein
MMKQLFLVYSRLQPVDSCSKVAFDGSALFCLCDSFLQFVKVSFSCIACYTFYEEPVRLRNLIVSCQDEGTDATKLADITEKLGTRRGQQELNNFAGKFPDLISNRCLSDRCFCLMFLCVSEFSMKCCLVDVCIRAHLCVCGRTWFVIAL